MPIFEYRCSECGEVVEKIERQPAETIECPRCGKPAGRIVSVFSGSAASSGPPPGCGGGGCGAAGGQGFR